MAMNDGLKVLKTKFLSDPDFPVVVCLIEVKASDGRSFFGVGKSMSPRVRFDVTLAEHLARIDAERAASFVLARFDGGGR